MNLVNEVSWKAIDEIKELSNRWPEIDICILENDLSTYIAYEHISDYIL